MADDKKTLEIARNLYGWIRQDIDDGDREAQTVSRIQVTLNELIDAERLTSNPAGKVAGYTAQPDAKVALVNSFKEDEERLLRKVDALFPDGVQFGGERRDQDAQREQQRWRAIARTHFQEGFMALNRAVFQPQRIRLPEDPE